MTFTEQKKNIIMNCEVCGDIARSFNFNGLCCESCKAFFCRNVHSNNSSEEIQCRLDGKCKIDRRTRRYCKRCRLDKCIAIGMKLDDEQHHRFRRKCPIQTKSNSKLITGAHDLALFAEMGNCDFAGNQSELALFNEAHSVMEAVNFAEILVRHLVEFCRKVSAFKCLTQSDQLCLLKGSHPEMAAICAAYFYDVTHDAVRVNVENRTGVLVKMNIFQRTQQITTIFRAFCRQMKHAIDNDFVVRDLILLQLLFKPRENVSRYEFVRYNHFVYGHLLRRYFEHKYQASSSKASQKYLFVIQTLKQINDIAGMIRQFHSTEIGQSNQLAQVLAEIYGLI